MARTTVTVTVSPALHAWANQQLVGFSQTLDGALSLLRQEDYRDIRDLYNSQKHGNEIISEERRQLKAFLLEKCGQEAVETCLLRARKVLQDKKAVLI